jgi:hypothetical protein
MRAITRTPALLGALAVMAIGSAPAFAQSSNSIVVTGKQLDEDQAAETIRRIATPVGGQLARFSEPVCPRVTGFETQYEAIVAKRIKAVAEAVGAGAAKEGCVTNLFVVIVDDGPEFVRELDRRHPEVFDGMSKREYTALANDAGAARTWTATALTNSMGQIAGTPAPTAGTGTVKWGYQGSSVSIGNAQVMRIYEGSNINPSVQQAIVSAWVVLETRETFGMTLTQIADYAAMRGLAMVRPDELAAGDDTILALFEPEAGAAPAELTEFDRAYLKSLYRVQGRRWARQQVRQMAGAIAREAEQAEP